jgi:hypothetical protein
MINIIYLKFKSFFARNEMIFCILTALKNERMFQIIKGMKYTYCVDWWSFGVLLVSVPFNFFSSSLMMRPKKLEGLRLVTLSSRFLEFEGKARGNPIGGPFRCFLLG